MKFKEMPTTFYMGRRYNTDTKQPTDEPVYYDSRDLTTHAVVVGMTGSGKTGLCISLLEEAALDNIPAIIIDPKGDITNLLLTFPDLRPEDFRPWVNVDDARREHLEPDEYATKIADRWREGLAESGIVPGRLRAYKNAAEFAIYTPGSDAGLPVSIVDSLQAPREGWVGYEESHRERINGTVTALLALIGKNADPVKDREHVLLANIFESAWKEGRDLSLEDLILQIQTPPFAKLGVFDIDTFFPQKERFKLAQAMNQIIAAPSFQTWMQGEPLDMSKLLYTHEGKPRVSIFYIAHLNDAERMFMMTLLLENMLSWMRTLDGTTSLRALCYIDEVFGYFPPAPYNPPTKGPLLRLLKQARAFGIGLILATQNPVDLDYKGLSNAGTWFIGKLQAEGDKKRILGGLSAEATPQTQAVMGKIEKMLGQLEQQVFVLHNVHNPEGPLVFHTRWAMSYLRGPLTRQQVRILMEPLRRTQKVTTREFARDYTPAAGSPAIPPPPPGTPPTSPFAAVNPAAGLFTGVRPQTPTNPSSGNTGASRSVNLPPTLPEAPSVAGSNTGRGIPPPPGFPEESQPASTFGSGLVNRTPVAPQTPPPQSPIIEEPPLYTPPEQPKPVQNTTPMTTGPVSASGFQRARPANVPDNYHETPAEIGNVSIAQYFVPMRLALGESLKQWEQKFGIQALDVRGDTLLYRPVLLAQAMARYLDRKSNIQQDELYCYQIPDVGQAGFINWDQYKTLPLDPNNLLSSPPENAWFGELSPGLVDSKRLNALKAEMIDNVYRTASITLFYNSTLDLYGAPGETRRDYSIRLQGKAREARDAEIEKVTAKYDTELERLDARLKKEMREHNTDLRALDNLRREETYTTGEAVFGLMRGRPTYTLSRMSRARRHKDSMQERAFANEQVITELEQALDAKQEELREALVAVNDKWAKIASTIEETKITPYKKDIAVQLFGIGWVPVWSVTLNNQPTLLPAT
jgi:hypothetical protein